MACAKMYFHAILREKALFLCSNVFLGGQKSPFPSLFLFRISFSQGREDERMAVGFLINSLFQQIQYMARRSKRA